MVLAAMSPIKILRAHDAASYTGLSESTLAKRRIRGEAPVFVRLGRRAIGYRLDDLDDWLTACRRQPTSVQGDR
jgi:predicted DNA-binding transcriptional regulator AlpA